jgi:hypothetical protein
MADIVCCLCTQLRIEALWKSLVPVAVPSPPAPNAQPDAAAAGPEVPSTPPAPKPRPAGRKRPRLPDAAPVQQQEEEETELSGGRPRRKTAKKALVNIHGWTAELRKKVHTPNKVSSCTTFVFPFFRLCKTFQLFCSVGGSENFFLA